MNTASKAYKHISRFVYSVFTYYMYSAFITHCLSFFFFLLYRFSLFANTVRAALVRRLIYGHCGSNKVRMEDALIEIYIHSSERI